MTNWFRDDGGPVFYGYSNRTSVTGDISMVACCLFFLTLYAAFLIIFPGIRKQRFSTFVTVTLSLFIGNVILITKLGSSWHVGRTQIHSVYCASSRELINADLGVYIGLDHVNITLKAIPYDNSSKVEDIDYNERFDWHGAHEMNEQYHEALIRGLPYPILTIAEYFSLRQEGFRWGSEYRAAGYYGSVLLWLAFATWLMMNLLMVVVPRYGAYAMIITSAFLLQACLIYYHMLPENPLTIRFEEDRLLTFNFGWCFWLNCFAGVICGMVGIIITVIDIIEPNRFSTILEVDYDTPYDRHIIIEDSHYHRKKRSNKGNEESAGLGRRILRRLSSKKDENDEKLSRMNGRENGGFELEPPNSPWRFAYRRPPIKDISFNRTISQDSSMSIASSSATVTFADQNSSTNPKKPLSRTLPKQESSSRLKNAEYPSHSITMW